MIKPTVLLDVDGVLADFAGALLDWAGPQYTRDHLSEWDLTKALGLADRQSEFDAVAGEPGFCESLPLLDGAQDFVEDLRLVADIVVVTSPYSAAKLWTYDRLIWLERHFKITKHDVIFAKRKHLVRGDVMIDDGPHNVEAFVRAGGRGLLIDQPWNRHYVTPLSLVGKMSRCRDLGHALAAVVLE
jgi:5'(3')-deoxyribonucleotidase